MITYDLYRFLREELRNGSSDLVTRPSGRMIRECIEREIAKEQDKSVIALSFAQIGVIDFSCADEIVAKLISRLLSNEYGDRYVLLSGLNGNQRENIEVALERKGLAVVGIMENGERVLLGRLNNYLKETFRYVMQKEHTTARSFSEDMGLEPNTGGMRLLNLHKKRLIKRVEDIRDGGRIWVYGKL